MYFSHRSFESAQDDDEDIKLDDLYATLKSLQHQEEFIDIQVGLEIG